MRPRCASQGALTPRRRRCPSAPRSAEPVPAARVQGGLHSRTGAREPGLTGAVPRAEQTAEASKRAAHQAPTAPAGSWLTGHTLLAALYAVATVLLFVAPELVRAAREAPLARAAAAAG